MFLQQYRFIVSVRALFRFSGLAAAPLLENKRKKECMMQNEVSNSGPRKRKRSINLTASQISTQINKMICHNCINEKNVIRLKELINTLSLLVRLK